MDTLAFNVSTKYSPFPVSTEQFYSLVVPAKPILCPGKGLDDTKWTDDTLNRPLSSTKI